MLKVNIVFFRDFKKIYMTGLNASLDLSLESGFHKKTIERLDNERRLYLQEIYRKEEYWKNRLSSLRSKQTEAAIKNTKHDLSLPRVTQAPEKTQLVELHIDRSNFSVTPCQTISQNKERKGASCMKQNKAKHSAVSLPVISKPALEPKYRSILKKPSQSAVIPGKSDNSETMPTRQSKRVYFQTLTNHEKSYSEKISSELQSFVDDLEKEIKSVPEQQDKSKWKYLKWSLKLGGYYSSRKKSKKPQLTLPVIGSQKWIPEAD